MDKKLALSALAKFAAGVLLVALLLFLPAGTLSYANGWLLMGVLFVPMLAAGVVLLCKNPALLRSRLDAKEKEAAQKQVTALSGLMFLAGFVLSGLNFRFSWFPLPGWISVAAAVIFLAAYALYAEVLRENTYLSRTVGVQEGQRVIDTGLYGIVRHPMYSATILLFLAMPLVLGSLQALILFLCYPLLLIKRIRNEEALLARELDGYRTYMQKVRWRLIPFIW